MLVSRLDTSAHASQHSRFFPSQSSLIALLHEYVTGTAPSLGRILITELSMIVTKLVHPLPSLLVVFYRRANVLPIFRVPCVYENAKARDAFVSLCIHQVTV